MRLRVETDAHTGRTDRRYRGGNVLGAEGFLAGCTGRMGVDDISAPARARLRRRRRAGRALWVPLRCGGPPPSRQALSKTDDNEMDSVLNACEVASTTLKGNLRFQVPHSARIEATGFLDPPSGEW